MMKLRFQFFLVFLSAVLLLSLTGCNSDRKRLENFVTLLDKQCPYPVDDFGRCVGVTLVDDTIVYNCQATDSDTKKSLEKLTGQRHNLVKVAELGLLLNQDQKSLDKLLAWGVDVKYDVRDGLSKPIFAFTLRNDSLKNLQQRYANRDEMRLELLTLQTELSNVKLPIRVDAYTLFTHQEITATDLVYTYTVDERQMGLPLSMLKAETASMRGSIAKKWATTPELSKQARLLAKLNRGVVYHYQGNPSGDVFALRFTPREPATKLAGGK